MTHRISSDLKDGEAPRFDAFDLIYAENGVMFQYCGKVVSMTLRSLKQCNVFTYFVKS